MPILAYLSCYQQIWLSLLISLSYFAAPIPCSKAATGPLISINVKRHVCGDGWVGGWVHTCVCEMDSQTAGWILMKLADMTLGNYYSFPPKKEKKKSESVTHDGGKRIINFTFKKALKTVA